MFKSGPVPQPQPVRSSGLAVAALVCGIIGAVFGLIPTLGVPALGLGLVALVIGAIAWTRAIRGPGGKGAAIAGTLLGVVAIALGIAGIVTVNDAVNDLDESLDAQPSLTPTAPGDQNAQPQQPETYRLADAGAVTSANGTITGTYEVKSVDITKRIGHGFLSERVRNGYFVVVTLRAHARGSGFHVNPFDWALVDPPQRTPLRGRRRQRAIRPLLIPRCLAQSRRDLHRQDNIRRSREAR